MSSEIRPNVDSREAWTGEQVPFPTCGVCGEAVEDCVCEDWDECEEHWTDAEYDGQPDEYTEWQDYMGGDDWDHGQYDDPNEEY